MKRCTRCIMPETAQGIVIGQDGLCQLCRDFKEYIPCGEEALREELAGNVDHNAANNCVVPVSGGRDSSYALYYVKKVLGLKPLAVHNDNDFETEIANKNLETITRTLNVPLVRISSKRHITRKIVEEKFKMNAPFGPGLMVEQACEGCEYGFQSAAYNTARKEKIKVIIWGDSKDESTQGFHNLFQHFHPTKWERMRTEGFVSLLRYKYYFGKMKKEYGSRSPEGLKDIHLYDYVRWDQRVIVDTIQRELGWSVPDSSPTTWRVDCSLVPVVNYLTQKAYGVSKLEIGFSNMVRAGKMNRDDALKIVEQIRENTDVGKLHGFLREMHVSDRAIKKALG
jgi:glucosamine--fructose-6-phosphate aminotransferase (isomerizing)